MVSPPAPPHFRFSHPILDVGPWGSVLSACNLVNKLSHTMQTLYSNCSQFHPLVPNIFQLQTPLHRFSPQYFCHSSLSSSPISMRFGALEYAQKCAQNGI